MGVGILVMVVGAAIGVLLVAAPLGVGWLARKRNPLADEPSESIYWVVRAAGMAVILGSMVFGCVTVIDVRAQAVQDRTETELAEAAANFVPPAPSGRGLLPVLGYLSSAGPAGETLIQMYYIAPPESGTTQLRALAAAGKVADGRYACYAAPVQATNNGRVKFNAELIWSPEQLSDLDGDASCALNKYQFKEFTLGRVPAPTDIVTDAPIVSDNGTVVAFEAAGNVVPLLTERPDTSATRITGFDRGEIPMVGYQDDGNLAISYLKPDIAKVHAGRMDGNVSGGCEVVPTFTGLGSDTVTIGLRLVWSNPNGRAAAEDDANCWVGTTWSEVVTKAVDQIPSGTKILTNGPLADPDTWAVQPGKPGHVVPKTG